MREPLLVVVILAGAEAAALGASKPTPPTSLRPAVSAAVAEGPAQPSGKLVLTRFDERNRLQKLDDMNAFERAQRRGDCALLRCQGQKPVPTALSNDF